MHEKSSLIYMDIELATCYSVMISSYIEGLRYLKESISAWCMECLPYMCSQAFVNDLTKDYA